MDPELKKQIIEFIGNIKGVLPANATDRDICGFEIITHSDDPRVGDFRTPLLCALIRKDKYLLAEKLINTTGVVLDAKDTNNESALDYALLKGNVVLAKLLASKGCDTNHIPYHKHDELADDHMYTFNVPDEISIKDIILGNSTGLSLLEGQNSDAADYLKGLLGSSSDTASDDSQ